MHIVLTCGRTVAVTRLRVMGERPVARLFIFNSMQGRCAVYIRESPILIVEVSALRKKISLFLVVALVLSIFAFPLNVSAADYTTHWSSDHIGKLIEYGIMNGDPNGNFRPNSYISRAEMAALLVRLFGVQDSADLSAYADVKGTEWYYKELSAAKASGYMTGRSETSMAPEAFIKRSEAAALLVRAFGMAQADTCNVLFNDKDQFGWAAPYLNAMANEGYMIGNEGKMRPNDFIRRGETAKLLSVMTGSIVKKDVNGGTLYGNVIVVQGITLTDVTIQGNLIVTPGVGAGVVNFDGVTLSGALLVQGGKVVNVDAGSRISGGVDLAQVVPSQKPSLQIEAGAVVKRDKGGAPLRSEGNTAIQLAGKPAFTADVDVISGTASLSGSFNKIILTGDAVLAFAPGSTAEKVATDHAAHVTLGTDSNITQDVVLKPEETATVKNDKITIVKEPETPSGGTGGTGSGSSGGTPPVRPLDVYVAMLQNITLTDGVDTNLLLTAAGIIGNSQVGISITAIDHTAVDGTGKPHYTTVARLGKVTLRLTLPGYAHTVESTVTVAPSHILNIKKEYDTPMVYTQPLYYGVANNESSQYYVSGNARITVSGVTLRGVEIKGDLYINEGLEDIILDNVRVRGEVISINDGTTVIMRDSSTFGERNSTPITKDYVYGDQLPYAPALSERGDYGVGVRTMTFYDESRQGENYNITPTGPNDGILWTGPRPLTVEVWYPAVIPTGAEEFTIYDRDVLARSLNQAVNAKRPYVPLDSTGRALRNAEPDRSGGKYPLVVYSHGDPGFSVMISYLAEHLASHGYVVVAIDHLNSKHDDIDEDTNAAYKFRSDDIEFIIGQMALQAGTATSYLHNMPDADNVGIIGYSNGGQGVLNVAGAGYTTTASWNSSRAYNGGAYNTGRTDIMGRIKAVIAAAPNIGPFNTGGNYDTFLGIDAPSMWIVGDQDNSVGYDAVKNAFKSSKNSERYMLVYENCRHNPIANMPPRITLEKGVHPVEYTHYMEPAWSQPRLNNINQHFISAFLDVYLKGDTTKLAYIQGLPTLSSPDFTAPVMADNYWKGFPAGSALGMQFYNTAKGSVATLPA